VKKKNTKVNVVTTVAGILLFGGIVGTALIITNNDTVDAAPTVTDTTTPAVATTAEASAYSGASSYGTSTDAGSNATSATSAPAETKKEEVASTPVVTAPVEKPIEKPVETPKPVAEVKPAPKPTAPAYTASAPKTSVKRTEPKRIAEASTRASAVERTNRTETAVASPTRSSKEEKLLTDKELQHMLEEVVTKGDENALYLKCVQLWKTDNANNSRAFEQIEAYVRSRGYTIAGRETIRQQAKGLNVGPGNGCMRITVGSF
jgi:outer membrane biosynthesis protein TonB